MAYFLKNVASLTVRAKRHLLLVLLAIPFLYACSENQSTNLSDLHRFTESVRAREKPEIDPLPDVEPVEFFQYSASDKVSPFAIENVLPEVNATLKIDPVLPDQARPRQVLEYFALDSLQMVGTLKQEGRVYAVVFAPDNTVHRVSNGNYMGTQLGEIVNITDAEVVLEETVRAKSGGWEKRKVSVAIGDKK